MASSMPSASPLPPPPPPPYYSTESLDAPLLGKEEPFANSQPPPQYLATAAPHGAAAAAAAAPLAAVISQPQHSMLVINNPLGFESGTVMCPKCQQFVSTEVSYESGRLTWLLCVGMCLVGLNLGCCFVPFCLEACKDAVHECPICDTLLHRQNRI